MGGEIFVDTLPDKGSTFSFELALSNTIYKSTIENKEMANQATNNKMLLYVEDNPANMRVVEAIFERKENINLLTATNGKYGLELAKKYLPDLILLDIHLPKMSGYEILKKLKEDSTTKHIPVIALTADAMPLDIEKGLEAGFFQYVTKPIKINLFMDAINNALDETERSIN